MSHSIEVQMLNALEFFHYSYRFQHRLFILSLSEEIDLGNIITDLRVLNAARIQCLVVMKNYSGLTSVIEEWIRRGYPFEFIQYDCRADLGNQSLTSLKSQFESGKIPIIGLNDTIAYRMTQNDIDSFTINLARHFIVNKVFFLSGVDGLEIDQRFVSHLTPQEAQNKVDGNVRVNIGHERLSNFVRANLDFGFEIVLLKANSGCLFQEIFTHRGKGTLLTNEYPNVIRKGRISDVMDIALLLKPYVSSGAILPVTENSIADEVDAYYVYTVNNSIVAIAKLTDYGTATELAKFCTLPRYQGKGRARELAEKMIQTVKQADKKFIFALSIEPKMVEFFKSLGFSQCDRMELPEIWRKQYDMTRNSKAFKLTVNV